MDHWFFKKRKGAAALFRFFYFTPLLFAQETTPPPHLRASAASEYVDLFRQRTTGTETEIFARNSSAEVSYAAEHDTLTLRLSSIRRYGSYRNRTSDWSATARSDMERGSLRWESRISGLDYSLGMSIPLRKSNGAAGFSISLRSTFFSDRFSAEGTYSFQPSSIFVQGSFSDFSLFSAASENESKWSAAFQYRSAGVCTLSLETFYSTGKDHPVSDPYSVTRSGYAMGESFGGNFTLDHSTVIFADAGMQFSAPAVLLKKNDLSFGNLSGGEMRHYSAGAGIAIENITVRYRFLQIRASGAGVVESWPFTSLAASAVANRLLFTADGSVTVQMVDAGKKYTFPFGSVTPSLAYCYLLPDYRLKHWQPEFLVFGAEGFTYESSTIRDIHAVQGGVSVSFPLMGGTLMVAAEQYVPIAIRYRTRTTQVGTTPAGGSHVKNRTDGGRSVSIHFSL